MRYQCALQNVMRIDFTLCSCKNKESRKIILGGDEYVHLAMVTDHRCTHISNLWGYLHQMCVIFCTSEVFINKTRY